MDAARAQWVFCMSRHATHAESAKCRKFTLLCHLALFHPSQMQNHLKVLKRRLDQGSYIKLVGLVEQCCVAPLAFPSSMVLCHGLANPGRNWIWNSLTKLPVANVAASPARRCARKFWTSPPSVDAWPRKSVAHTLLTCQRTYKPLNALTVLLNPSKVRWDERTNAYPPPSIPQRSAVVFAGLLEHTKQACNKNWQHMTLQRLKNFAPTTRGLALWDEFDVGLHIEKRKTEHKLGTPPPSWKVKTDYWLLKILCAHCEAPSIHHTTVI